MSVICTLSGEQTIFVAFDDNDDKKRGASDCVKCPTCMVLSNASVWIPSFNLYANASFFRLSDSGAELPTKEVINTTFSHYLSQGPPARA